MPGEAVHPVFADHRFKGVHHRPFRFEHAVAVVAHFHDHTGLPIFQPFGPVADVAVGMVAVRAAIGQELQPDAVVQGRTASQEREKGHQDQVFGHGFH